MIEQNELRIGNMVQVLGHIETVKEITTLGGTHEMGVVLGEWGEHSSDFNYNGKAFASLGIVLPIPLTEEMLLKCGFKKDLANVFHDKISLYEGKIKEEGFRLYGQYAIEKVKVKYLHQLQNLYFTLTGNELKYKYGWADVKVMIDGKEVTGINSIEYVPKLD
jgi:hypothetical protein